MTDRICVLTVMLTDPTRVDDVQPIIDAILMVKGVTSVTTGVVADASTYWAKSTALRELKEKLWAILKEDEQ